MKPLQPTAETTPLRPEECVAPTPPIRVPTSCAVLLVVAAVLNLTVFAVRVNSLLAQGSLTTTTGYEGPIIYSVWKAVHHHTLYEKLSSPLSSNTLYNYLFYHTYATIINALASEERSLLRIGRVTTAAFSALGLFLSMLSLSVMGLLRNKVRFISGLASGILFWFSSSPVGWFALSIRPDIAAVSLAAAGLLLCLCYLREHKSLYVVLSSLAFFLSWSFKQNVVLTFAGTFCFYVLCIRRWKILFLHTAPFALCLVCAIYLGGPDYRFNTLVVPTLGTLALGTAWTFPVKALFENPTIYCTLPLCLIVAHFKTPRPTLALSRQSSNIPLLGIAFLVTFLGGTFFCLRAGSDRNYFFEAGMVASLALLPALLILIDKSEHIAKVWITITASTVCLVTVIQLLAFAVQSQRGPSFKDIPFLGKTEFGRLQLLTRQQERERTSVAEFITTHPKPLLITDDIFSQPWFSTGDAYPAFVEDPNIASNLLEHNILRTDPVVAAIRLRKFQTLLLSAPTQDSAALREGYVFAGDVGNSLHAFTLKPVIR